MSPIEQLAEIEARCLEIEATQPKRRASRKYTFTGFDKSLRDGIVFYSTGWGWRLRNGWREALEAKRAALVEEKSNEN